MAPPKRAEGARPAGHERLRRLLFLVPYVSRRPGIPVAELAAALSLSREELLADLDLLTLVGRPPYQPDDYIDIYLENDRVYIDLDMRFSAPPRLTAAEAVALAAAAELLRPAASDALSGALHKLEKVIPPGSLSKVREMGKKLDLSLDGPPALAPLNAAVAERREVELDYFSANRGSSERRTVQPLELFSHRGQWYLSAFCCTRQDERLFRLDRIGTMQVTDRRFTARPAPSRGVPNPAQPRGEVRVRFSPRVAPYQRERFGDAARSLPDGGVEVRVLGDSERWLTQWILSFGGEAEVVEPEWARAAVARSARASVES
jgi:proteasome accessory factor C